MSDEDESRTDPEKSATSPDTKPAHPCTCCVNAGPWLSIRQVMCKYDLSRSTAYTLKQRGVRWTDTKGIGIRLYGPSIDRLIELGGYLMPPVAARKPGQRSQNRKPRSP